MMRCFARASNVVTYSLAAVSVEAFAVKPHTFRTTVVPKPFRFVHHATPTNRYLSTNDGTDSSRRNVNVEQMSEELIRMHSEARSIISAGISAVDPRIAIQSCLSVNVDVDVDTFAESASSLTVTDGTNNNILTYHASEYDEIQLVGFGKASPSMALATAEILSQVFKGLENTHEQMLSGVVITKDDHATPHELYALQTNHNIRVLEASHPVPDQRGIDASQTLWNLITSTSTTCNNTKKRLVVVCVSGGGSSLFCLPNPPLTLSDLQRVNECLLKSGMTIQDMNVIRSCLEVGKGGGIARACADSGGDVDVLGLVLSDVIGDPLEFIASGPTVLTATNGWNEAQSLIQDPKFGLLESLPKPVVDMILTAEEPEDTNATRKTTSRCDTILIGNNARAVNAAAQTAKQLGYHPLILSTTLEGEASAVAALFLSTTTQIVKDQGHPSLHPDVTLPVAIIGGGEPTVTLGEVHGKGGRNQELALTAALHLQQLQKNKTITNNVVMTSVGTDGTDGPTDAAGAVVDGGTVDRIEALNGGTVRGVEALQRHDAYTFFDSEEQQQDDTGNDDSQPRAFVKTGPTGTNVADIIVTLIR